MRKPRPTPDPKFVFDPASDTAYVHFDGHQTAPFDPKAASMTRANAWWLAESALLAYWGAADAIPRFRRAGLDAEFFEQQDTQAYVAWTADAVLVTFRGTQPGSVDDIVSDVLVPLVDWPTGKVHFGFKAALERVWTGMIGRIEALASSRSVWFSGHSLGAALATLAADRFRSTAGVCTIGSPRAGNRAFAAAFDTRFGDRALRYVNDTDIVTHVPTPFPLSYNHVGALRQISPEGVITSQVPALAHFVTAVFGDVDHVAETMNAVRAGTIQTAPDFLLDHMPRSYAVDIWNDFDAHRDA
jgi:triacylglycerol lipase